MTAQPIRGALLLNTPPLGYRLFERRASIGAGTARWDFAAREILSWGIKIRSGFTIGRGETLPAAGEFTRTGIPSLFVGDQLWLSLRVGPFHVREPVRVIAIVDEPNRKGFAYETRPGH